MWGKGATHRKLYITKYTRLHIYWIMTYFTAFMKPIYCFLIYFVKIWFKYSLVYYVSLLINTLITDRNKLSCPSINWCEFLIITMHISRNVTRMFKRLKSKTFHNKCHWLWANKFVVYNVTLLNRFIRLKFILALFIDSTRYYWHFDQTQITHIIRTYPARKLRNLPF